MKVVLCKRALSPARMVLFLEDPPITLHRAFCWSLFVIASRECIQLQFRIGKFRCPRNSRSRGAMGSQQHTGGVFLVSRRASFSWRPCPCLCPWSSSPRWCATARTEQKTLLSPYTGPSNVYVGHEPRTTVDFPFNRKDDNELIPTPL
jgi:hypothetical protein